MVCVAVKDVEVKWQEEWGNKIWFSHGESNRKGVAILLDGNLDYKINEEIIDEGGRYIILDLDINSTRTIVTNSYAPNEDCNEFFDGIISRIEKLGCDNVIWGGDHNLVLDTSLDKEGGLDQTHWKCRDSIKNYISGYNMCDVWRLQHTSDRVFTWHSNPRTKIDKTTGKRKLEIIQCRLDFFIIPFKLLQSTVCNKITPGYHSDHALVTLSVQINTVPADADSGN